VTKKIKTASKQAICLIAATLMFFVAVNPPIQTRAATIVIGGGAVAVAGGLGYLIAAAGGVGIGAAVYGAYHNAEEINALNQLMGQNTGADLMSRSGMTAIESVVQVTQLLSRRNVQTPQGAVEVPFLSTQTTFGNFETLLTEARTPWQNLRGMQEAATAGENYFFCFFDQTMRPIPPEALRAFTPAPAPPHPLYIGIIGGLPIIQWSGNSQQMMDAQRQHAVEEVLVNGRLYSFGDLQNNAVDIFEDGNVMGTVTVHQDLWRVPTGFVGIYDAIYGVVNLFFIQHEIAGRSSWRDSVASDVFRGTNQEITPPITTTPDLIITTTTPNILDNLNAVMDEFRAIAGITDANEPIILNIPYINRADFPWVGDDAWPAFLQMLINSMTRQDLVMNPADAQPLINNPDIPQIVTNTEAPPIEFPPLPDIDLSGILPALGSIVAFLQWIPEATVAGISLSIDAVRSTVQNVTTTIDTALAPPLREIRDFASNIRDAVTDVIVPPLEAARDFAGNISDAVTDVIVPPLEAARDFAENIFDAVTDVIGPPLEAIRDFTNDFALSGLPEVARDILQSVGAVGTTIIDGLRVPLEAVRSTVQNVTTTIALSVAPPLNAIRDRAADIYAGVIAIPGTIIDGLRVPIEAVRSTVQNVTTTIAMSVAPPLNAIRDRAADIYAGVIAIPGTITDFLNPPIDSLRGWLEGMRARMLALPGAIAGAIAATLVGSMEFDTSRFEQSRGWHRIFPFSIPWDIRNVIEAILGGSAGQRPAPVITMDFNQAGFDAVVRIDMADWEVVAQVLRWGIVVVFLMAFMVALGRRFQS